MIIVFRFKINAKTIIWFNFLFFHVETSPNGSKIGHNNNKIHTRIKKMANAYIKKQGQKITLLPIG